MTSRDLDEAVARLRAASLRNDPGFKDPVLDESAADLGPPRGRPDGAGQPIVDPDITEARAQIAQGSVAPLAEMPPGAIVPPQRREPVAFDRSWPQDVHNAPPVGAERRARFGLPHDLPSPGEPIPLDETAHGRARRVLGAIGTRAWSYLAAQRAAFAARREAARAEKAARAEAAEQDFAGSSDLPLEERPRARLARHEPRLAPPTARERRRQRRRRRYLMEEILGWILVPIILIGIYFGMVGLLAASGYTIDDVMEGVRTVMQALG